jgi:hypothetical protein
VFFSRSGNDKSFNACRDQPIGISAKTFLQLTDLSDIGGGFVDGEILMQWLKSLITCLKQLSKPESLNRCLAQASSCGLGIVRNKALL